MIKLTVSEAIPPSGHSLLQQAINHISIRSKENLLQIHRAKFKAIFTTLKRTPVDLVPMQVDRIQFENVLSSKVLDLTVQNDLKWNTQVNEKHPKLESAYTFYDSSSVLG